jgi:hypothetical protein
MIPRIAKVAARGALGFVSGYASFCVLVVLHEVLRDLVHTRTFDGERTIYACLSPLAIIDALLIGDWAAFFRYADMSYIICYISIALWTWWFLPKRRKPMLPRADGAQMGTGS